MFLQIGHQLMVIFDINLIMIKLFLLIIFKWKFIFYIYFYVNLQYIIRILDLFNNKDMPIMIGLIGGN